MQIKNGTSSTSLPCSWLHHHLKLFLVCQYLIWTSTTPRCKRKATFHEINEVNVNTDEGDNDVNTDCLIKYRYILLRSRGASLTTVTVLGNI